MEIEFWRNLAIIWLSLFCIVGLIVPIVGLYFAVRGMSAATTAMPRLLGNAQSTTRSIRSRTDRLSNSVAQPVLSAQQKVIQAGETVRALGVRDHNSVRELGVRSESQDVQDKR